MLTSPAFSHLPPHASPTHTEKYQINSTRMAWNTLIKLDILKCIYFTGTGDMNLLLLKSVQFWGQCLCRGLSISHKLPETGDFSISSMITVPKKQWLQSIMTLLLLLKHCFHYYIFNCSNPFQFNSKAFINCFL